MKIVIEIDKKNLHQITREIVKLIWKFHGENTSHTAKRLGVSLRAVRNWIKEEGWERNLPVNRKPRIYNSVYMGRVKKMVHEMARSEQEAQDFLNTPNHLLGGKTPHEAVEDGRGRYVIKLLNHLGSLDWRYLE